MIVKNEELQAQFTLPEPITGAVYADYIKGYNSVESNPIVRGMAAALAVIESGTYIKDDIEHSLKTEGMNAESPILAWLQAEVAHYMTAAIKVPKLSFETQSSPPTEKAKPR